MNEVERIWTRARVRYGNWRDRRLPSPGIAALVLALAEQDPWNPDLTATELARRSGQAQSNVSVWLRKLDRWRFAQLAATQAGVGGGHHTVSKRKFGGARPAQFWELTRAGHDLADALRREAATQTPRPATAAHG